MARAAGESSVQALNDGESSVPALIDGELSVQEFNDDVLSIIFSKLSFINMFSCRHTSHEFRRILIYRNLLALHLNRRNPAPLLGVYQTKLHWNGSLKPEFTELDPENIIDPRLCHDLYLNRIPLGRVFVCDGRLGRLLFVDRSRPSNDPNDPTREILAFSVYNPLLPSRPTLLPDLTCGQSEYIKAYGILPEGDEKFRVFAIIRSELTLQLRIFCSGEEDWRPSRIFQIQIASLCNVNRPPVLYKGRLYILFSDGDLLRVLRVDPLPVDPPIWQLSAFPLPEFPLPDMHAPRIWGTENNVALAHTGEHLYCAAVYNLRLYLWTATHVDNEALIWQGPVCFNLFPLVSPAVVLFFNTNSAEINWSCILAFAETAHVLILKLGMEVYFFHLRLHLGTSLLVRSHAQPVITQNPGVAYEGVMFYLK